MAKLLWLYLRVLWKKNIISDQWRKAEGIFIPKENGATAVEKFRTISFLNVEGKLQLGLLARKMTTFTLANGYIDSSIQKGGIPGVSGCLEHTTVLSQLIREAKVLKKNLVATWLDIADAYGSMPHQLTMIALRRAHVPEEIVTLIDSYYKDVSIRFSAEEFITEWQQLEKGIVTGCTLSVILFSLTMTMLVLTVREETKGPKSASGQQQQNTRLFMDDVTTTTETLVQTSYLLDELAAKLDWGRLQVKPEKCRSLVIWEGEIVNKPVKIGGKVITSIKEKPVKYLGKEYKASLNDKDQIEEAATLVKDGLKRIDKTRIPGRYKAWIVQHMLLPRILWPLMIYAIPMSKVEEIQKLITKALKKWLRLPRFMSSEILYAKTLKLQLPYTSLKEEVKAAKARSLVTMQQSKDECVRNAEVNMDAGRKWKVSEAVNKATSRLHHQEIAGIPNIGREGIGMNHRHYYSKSTDTEKRHLIVDSIREDEEEQRYLRVASLPKQGASLKWEIPGRKISHRDLLLTSEAKLQFLVKSVYDLLPTPANKNVWFKTEEYKCMLCGEHGSLNHLLSGCKIALQQGRYTWRHNKVLKEIAYWVEEKRREQTKTPSKKRRQWINFVKAGEKRKTTSQEPASYFNTADDWKLQVDLNQRVRIPVEIADTRLRPDMILVSAKTKQFGIIELTVPSETRIGISEELKRAKYAELEEQSHRNGWKTKVWTVEIGSRGFAAGSAAILLKEIGYRGRKKKTIIKKIEEITEEASSMIWRWSHVREWGRTEKD